MWIRPALASDLPVLESLHAASGLDAYAAPPTLPDPALPEGLLLADDGAGVVGYVRVSPGGFAYWRLDLLGVDPASQRLGVGRRLLSEVTSRASREGVTGVWGVCPDAAAPFYRRCRFDVLERVLLWGPDQRTSPRSAGPGEWVLYQRTNPLPGWGG